jgi:hypothetical protein
MVIAMFFMSSYLCQVFSCQSPIPQDQRQKIFADFVKVGGNVEHLVLKYEAGLTESQASNIKWGFRPEKWLEDRHGAKKAKKLINRKLSLGLLPGCTMHVSVQPQRVTIWKLPAACVNGLGSPGGSKTLNSRMMKRRSCSSP